MKLDIDLFKLFTPAHNYYINRANQILDQFKCKARNSGSTILYLHMQEFYYNPGNRISEYFTVLR